MAGWPQKKTIIQKGVLVVINNSGTNNELFGPTYADERSSNTNVVSDPQGFEPRIGASADKDIVQMVFSKTFGLTYLNQSGSVKTKDLLIGDWDHRFPKINGKPALSGTSNCRNCVRCLISNHDYSDADGLVLAISTHGCGPEGEAGEVLLQFLDGYMLPASEVFHVLSDGEIPSLKGKPRILLLQACRSSGDTNQPNNKANDAGQGVIVDGADSRRRVKVIATVPIITKCARNIYFAPGVAPMEFDETTPEVNVTGAEQSATNASPWNAPDSEPIIAQPTDPEPQDQAPPSSTSTHATPTANLPQEPPMLPVPNLPQRTRFPPITIPENFLVIYPTTAGRFSFRAKYGASWMESQIALAFAEQLNFPEMDVLKFFTEVARRVARLESIGDNVNVMTGMKNAICVVHRLKKAVIFRKPRVDNQELPPPNPPTV